MKQLEVQIMGQSYLLGCPENGDARMLDAVNRVDIAMCKIRDAGKIKARDRIAVLAALNLAFELTERGVQARSVAESVAPDSQNGDQNAGQTDTDSRQPELNALLSRLDNALRLDGQPL